MHGLDKYWADKPYKTMLQDGPFKNKLNALTCCPRCNTIHGNYAKEDTLDHLQLMVANLSNLLANLET